MQLAIDEQCLHLTTGARHRPLTISRGILVLLSGLLALALALLQPVPRERSTASTFSTGSDLRADASRRLHSARPGEGAVWLHGSYALGEPTREQLAFRMSGLFSAELYWNGRLIGRKGVPAAQAADEVVGPIDAAIVLPASVLRPDNHWSIRLSSHHAGYAPATRIHGLGIGPYRSAGRDLAHYLPALLVFGALLACAAWGLTGWLALTGRGAGTLALSAIFLGAALAAEVSRGVVNYPYEWHVVRQAITLTFLGAHAVLLLLGSSALTGGPPSLDRPFWAVALMAVVAGVASSTGFDQKMLCLLAVCYLAMAARAALRTQPNRGQIATAALSLLAFAMLLFRMEVHMDAGAYAFGLALLTAALAQAVPAARPDTNRQAAAPQQRKRILLGFTGSERIVDWDDLQALRASGNYTQALLGDGTSILDRRSFSRLLELAPPRFVRVHRSYAANLGAARSLKRVRRGSHQLVLAGGSRIPVSRGRFREVRETIGAASTAAEDG